MSIYIYFSARRGRGYDFANGKATVLGTGDAEISFLSRPDIARYVGFIFTNLPIEKFEWKVFRLEADRGVRMVRNLLTPLMSNKRTIYECHSHSTVY